VEEHFASQAVVDELEDLYRGLEVARARLVHGEIVKVLTILGQISPRFEWLTKHTAIASRDHERLLVSTDLKATEVDLIPANDGAADIRIKKDL
jgi:hypothetical protein